MSTKDSKQPREGDGGVQAEAHGSKESGAYRVAPPHVVSNQIYKQVGGRDESQSKGDGFCRGFCAGLCCYCCLDICF